MLIGTKDEEKKNVFKKMRKKCKHLLHMLSVKKWDSNDRFRDQYLSRFNILKLDSNEKKWVVLILKGTNSQYRGKLVGVEDARKREKKREIETNISHS